MRHMARWPHVRSASGLSYAIGRHATCRMSLSHSGDCEGALLAAHGIRHAVHNIHIAAHFRCVAPSCYSCSMRGLVEAHWLQAWTCSWVSVFVPSIRRSHTRICNRTNLHSASKDQMKPKPRRFKDTLW